jgi:hypothetical protein
MRKFLALLLVVPFSSSICQVTEDFQIGLASVNPDYIKASMKFLADDLLEGRQPGTRGFEIASRYAESEFITHGLLPGVGNSYIQKVPLKKGVTDIKASSFTMKLNDKTETWSYADHFLISPNL